MTDDRLHKLVHSLAQGMNLREMNSVLKMAESLKKISDPKKKVRYFFSAFCREIKNGKIKSKTIREAKRLQEEYFK